MELQGTVKKIMETQTFQSGFQKRELILLTQEQYPQTICVEFLADKVSLLDQFAEGDEVKISINIRGREWQNPQGEMKYFTTISGWRIEKGAGGAANEPTVAPPSATPTTKNEDPFSDDEEDDLPF